MTTAAEGPCPEASPMNIPQTAGVVRPFVEPDKVVKITTRVGKRLEAGRHFQARDIRNWIGKQTS